MPKPSRQIIRVTTASVCAVTLAMSLDALWPKSSPSAEIHFPLHSPPPEHLAMLNYLPPGTTLWPLH